MINVRITGGNFDPILRFLDTMARPDLSPLAGTIREIMLRGNREGLMAGTDSYGHAMTPLEPSTIRRRKGTGPPLVGEGEASSLIRDYQVDIEDIPNGKRLVGSWPNTPYVHFHVTGTRNMVSRDPADVRPAGQLLIAEALERFTLEFTGGRL